MPKLSTRLPVQTPAERRLEAEALVSGGLLKTGPVAVFLDISESAVGDLVRDGTLPYVRVLSGDRRIPKAALIKYCADRLVQGDAV